MDRGHLRRSAVALVCTMGLVVAAGCGDDTAPTSTTAEDPGPPYAVVGLERTYVDPTRTTEDPTGTHSAPARSLETMLWVPEGPGPFPVVIFAHGHGGHPRKVSRLLDAWAEAGYVAAAPAFPLTNEEIEERHIPDVLNLPADISFLVDAIAEEAATGTGPLAGRVDPERVAVAGHSLGGGALYALLANTCCMDDRVRAGLAFAALLPEFEDGEYLLEPERPVLVVHGEDDHLLPHEYVFEVSERWPGPMRLLSLVDGRHSDPFEDVESPHDDLVVEVTLLFLDAHLRDDADALAALEAFEPPADLGYWTDP